MAYLLKTRSLQELNTICITTMIIKKKKIAPPLVQLEACSCHCVCGVVYMLVTDLQINSSMALGFRVDFGTLLSTAEWWQIRFYKCKTRAKNRVHLPITQQQLYLTAHLRLKKGWATTGTSSSFTEWQQPQRCELDRCYCWNIILLAKVN